MKIYISEKENIDLSKKCYLTFSTKDKEAVDWNVLAQSLEQHEAKIRKPLEDKIKELIKQLDLNDKEHFKNALIQLRETDYDTIRKQERLKVISELEEFIDKTLQAQIDLKHNIAGLNFIDALYLKQKLNEMKGEN